MTRKLDRHTRFVCKEMHEQHGLSCAAIARTLGVSLSQVYYAVHNPLPSLITVSATKAEIAWAAGLFEGEGTVGRTHRGRLFFTVKMNDREPLVRFAAILGIGTLRGPYPRRDRLLPSPYWMWSCLNLAECEAIFQVFRPWLSSRRIEQFEKTLRR